MAPVVWAITGLIRWARGVAEVGDAGVGVLPEDELGEGGEPGFQAIPDPHDDVLGGGLGEALDVVEVVVVELVDGLVGDAFDLGEVDDPAHLGVEIALDVDDQAVGVAVEAGALVGGGEVVQAMGGVERELSEDLHGVGLGGVGER